MKKVLCLIYPNFSLYEVVGLTSTLALSFGVEVDYASSDRNVIRTEDGLPCQPTRILDEVVIEDYSCVILPGMINIVPALTILHFVHGRISKLKRSCKIRTSLRLLALHIKRLREKCFLV